MSILQEYEKIKKDIGSGKYDAIEDYLNTICSKDNLRKYEEEINKISFNSDDDWVEKMKDLKVKYGITDLSDILYKEVEWKKFDKWFKKYLKPFDIIKYNSKFSVCLHNTDFKYDWVQEIQTKNNVYGDGHCYNDLFFDYLRDNFESLCKRLYFDSENGMFCVRCVNKHDAEEVSFILSKLYKNEEKMIQLIKDTKLNRGYEFDIRI